MGDSSTDFGDRTGPRQPGNGSSDLDTLATGTWSLMQSDASTANGARVDLPALYHQIYDRMQQGEKLVESLGIREGTSAAFGTYSSAIRAADAIPRGRLELELVNLERERLLTGELGRRDDRQLQQETMDLDSVIRGPVFTRANLGLLMLRNGMKVDGFRLLSEAAQIDREICQDYQRLGITPSRSGDHSILPMMKDDPNFQRHLVAAIANGFRVNGIDAREIARHLSAAFEPPRTDANSEPIADQTLSRVANAVGSGDGTRILPTVLGDATGNADHQEMSAQPDSMQSKSSVMRTLEFAEQNFERSNNKNQWIRGNQQFFELAREQAEERYAQVYRQLPAIQAQIEQQFPPAAQAEYKQLNNQMAAAIQSMSPEDQQTYAKVIRGQLSREDSLAFLNSHADLKQIITRQTELTQPIVPLLIQEAQINQAMQEKLLSGILYAKALVYAASESDTRADDREEWLTRAKQVFNHAFTLVPKEVQSQWLNDQSVQLVGTACGAIPQTDANATGSESPQQQSLKSVGDAGSDRPQQPSKSVGDAGSDRPQQPLKSSGDADIDRLVQTNSYERLMAQAQNHVQKSKGDIQEAEPYFKAACFVADSHDPAQLHATLQQALTELKRSDLTPQQRLQDHMIACQQIGMLSQRVLSHELYGLMLNSAHRFADAQAQMELAVANSKFDQDNPQATNFDARLIQEEIVQIQKDLNNQQFSGTIDPTWLNNLSATAQQLQHISQLPISEREKMAQFYLAGGKNPNGTPIGVPMITGYDTNGLAVQKTYQDNHILEPQKAADLINDAVRLQQQINQADVLNHPELDRDLAALRVAVSNNAPDSLKKALAESSRYWQNASSTFWSNAAGLAMAVTTICLTKGKAAGLLGEVGLGRLALAGAAGFGTATLTNYGMQKGVHGREDWTFGDSLLQGGGTFALTGGSLVLLKNSIWAGKAAKWTAEAAHEMAPAVTARTLKIAAEDVRLPQMAMQFRGLAGQTANLNEVVSTLGASAKHLQFGDLATISANGERLSNLIATVGKGGKNLEAVAEAARGSELESLALRMANDSGVAKAVTSALGDTNKLASAMRSAAAVQESMGASANLTLESAGKILAGNHLQIPPALASLLERYPNARYADLLTVAKNQRAVSEMLLQAAQETNPAAKFSQLAAAAGGDIAQLGTHVTENANLLAVITEAAKDAGLAGDLGNVWGATNSVRLASALEITPTYLRGLNVKDAAAVKTALDAAARTESNSIFGRALARLNPARALKGAEWGKLSADVVPTRASRLIGRTQAGLGSALPFTLGNNYLQDQISYNHGYTDVTPWQSAYNSLSFTGGPHTLAGINTDNVILQSLVLASMVGGLHGGAPLMRSASEAWQEAKFAKPGLQNMLSWGTASARVPLHNAWHGAFNVLNPGGAAGTYSEFLRQTLYPPTAYVTGWGLLNASFTRSEQKPWLDSLQNIGQPITNQNYYVPPILDGNMQPVNQTQTHR